MPFSTSLVPHFDISVHIVLHDFGEAGRAYRETDEEDTNLGSVVDDLLTGQFNNPVRVVAFNTSEGWSRDVSEDVAREVRRRRGLISAIGILLSEGLDFGKPLILSDRRQPHDRF
jgi:hypothetical protein